MEFVPETISERFMKKRLEVVIYGLLGGIASLHKIRPPTWFYKVSYYNNSALTFHNLFLNLLNGFDVRFLN
jgi:hypothetical protein